MLMKSRLFEEAQKPEDVAPAPQAECRLVGEGVGFERIRRITGYLVGTLDRFNNAKRAEEHDRVRHA
ncbi:MAG: hypothetical protein K2G99_04140 [Desulfovibrio sp.]|nr:hypothetical protein [Desulfovibrio sp.]